MIRHLKFCNPAHKFYNPHDGKKAVPHSFTMQMAQVKFESGLSDSKSAWQSLIVELLSTPT